MRLLMRIFLCIFLIPFFVSAQNVGDPAPDFSYISLSGDTITLSQYAGKVVFIFTFGNRCGSCRAVGNDTETRVNKEQAAGFFIGTKLSQSVQPFHDDTLLFEGERLCTAKNV